MEFYSFPRGPLLLSILRLVDVFLLQPCIRKKINYFDFLGKILFHVPAVIAT